MWFYLFIKRVVDQTGCLFQFSHFWNPQLPESILSSLWLVSTLELKWYPGMITLLCSLAWLGASLKHLITCSICIFMTPEILFFFFPSSYSFQIDHSVNIPTQWADLIQNWPGKQKNAGYFANLLSLKWVVLHLSMVFSLSEHVCQLAFVRAREGKKKKRRDEGKGKGELSSSRCSLATEKRQKRELVSWRRHNRPLLFSPHLFFSLVWQI